MPSIKVLCIHTHTPYASQQWTIDSHIWGRSRRMNGQRQASKLPKKFYLGSWICQFSLEQRAFTQHEHANIENGSLQCFYFSKIERKRLLNLPLIYFSLSYAHWLSARRVHCAEQQCHLENVRTTSPSIGLQPLTQYHYVTRMTSVKRRHFRFMQNEPHSSS